MMTFHKGRGIYPNTDRYGEALSRPAPSQSVHGLPGIPVW